MALARPFFARSFAVLAIVVLAAMGSLEARAQASTTCESILAAADERYVLRAFDEAEALARACLAQAEVGEGEAVRAYRLLALIALRRDDLPGAEEAVRQLLAVAPDYAPDPVQDTPAYVDLLTVIKERVREEGPLAPAADATPADSIRAMPPAPQTEAEAPDIEIVRTDPDAPDVPIPTADRTPPRERSGITRWLLVGGGVVAAGLAAVLLTAGGSSSPPSGGTPLPPPPPFPR